MNYYDGDFFIAESIYELRETIEHMNDTPEEKERWKREKEELQKKSKRSAEIILFTLMIAMCICLALIAR